MPLTVIADAAMGPIVEDSLAHKIKGNVALVFLELPPVRSNYSGLDNALELVKTGQPVLMVGFSYLNMLAEDRRFHLAMSYCNVRYEELPLTMGDMEQMLVEMLEGRSVRPTNLLVRRVFSLPEMQQNELSGIQHDLDHAQRAEEGSTRRAEMDDRWMPRARKLFGDLDRDGLIAAVNAVEQTKPDYAPFAGESFDAVCCDVEGTLMGANYVIEQGVKTLLQEVSKTRPVVLWTGGNLKANDKRLRKAGISYPLVPKSLLRGATVAVAIDDLSQEEFYSTYGIKVENYYRHI